MTEPANIKHDQEFSLFDEEERILKRAATMIDKLQQVAHGVRDLSQAYRQSYREQRRLLRISDRLQLDLHKANQALDAENIERQRLEAELRHVATTDDLTGLRNRRHILQVAAQEERGWREHGKSLSLILIDIDDFKMINDTYGHAAGDELLKRFADVCRQEIRHIDMMGRTGGEEFLVILPDTALESACKVAERLRFHTAQSRLMIDSNPVQITISAGVCEFDEIDGSIEHAISRADAALYRAKQTGRDRVERVARGDD